MVQQEQIVRSDLSTRRGLYAIIVVLFISYVTLAVSGKWNSKIPYFLCIYFLSFGVYGLSLCWLWRGKLDRFSACWILIPAIAFRITLLWCEPSLSEDFYRYLWDGRVQLSERSPYEFPPRAPELQELRDENYEKINHKEFRTPYPAAAEIFYHLFALISTRPWIFKSLIASFDLLLLECLRRLLKKENRKPAWLLVYAWHPLPIVEFAGSGHMDILGISFLALTYLLLQTGQSWIGGITFAVSALTKYLPVLTLPWLVKQGKWKFLLAAAVASLVLLLRYFSPDLQMFSGVLVFYKKWRFNDFLFGFLYNWLGGAEPARIAGILITVSAVAISLLKGFSFYRAAFIAFGSVILFSPVVHPWYLCWVLPFLVFHPNKSWIFFCGWIVLAYLVRHFYPVGVWKPILWLKLLIYVPFFVSLIVETYYGRKKAVSV